MASSTSELESGSLNTSLQSTTGSLHTVEQDEAAAVSYMQQLTSLLSTDDDIQVIRATHALRQDIARAQARTQATAKQAISALQKTVDREAEAIATTSDKAQWERALASAQAEKRRLLAELQRARAGHDTTRAAIDDIRRQIGATRTAIERIGTDSAAQIPRVRCVCARVVRGAGSPSQRMARLTAQRLPLRLSYAGTCSPCTRTSRA